MLARPDEEIMLLVQNDDNKSRDAFAFLYNRHKTQVFTYLFHLVRDRAIAEELTQETFLKAFRYKKQYKPEYSFKAWLWTIAKNSAYDQLRKKSEVKVDESLLEIAGADGEDEIFELYMQKEEGAILQSILAKLSFEHREVLLLWLTGELDHKQMSLVLNRSVDGVKSLLKRAKKDFCQVLENKMTGKVVL